MIPDWFINKKEFESCVIKKLIGKKSCNCFVNGIDLLWKRIRINFFVVSYIAQLVIGLCYVGFSRSDNYSTPFIGRFYYELFVVAKCF